MGCRIHAFLFASMGIERIGDPANYDLSALLGPIEAGRDKQEAP